MDDERDEDGDEDDLYLSAPEGKGIQGFMEILKILHKYLGDKQYFLDAQHDIISFALTREDLSPESEDGRRLRALGCHVASEEGHWSYYT